MKAACAVTPAWSIQTLAREGYRVVLIELYSNYIELVVSDPI